MKFQISSPTLRSAFIYFLGWEPSQAPGLSEHEPSMFEKMPLEVLKDVFAGLPIPDDKIHLALTCKYAFYGFQSVSRYHGVPISYFLTLRRLYEPRSLSEGLELHNNRWICCPWCEKAHPRSRRDELRITLRNRMKPCRLVEKHQKDFSRRLKRERARCGL